MSERDPDPYETYRDGYYTVRQGTEASADEIEDVLLEAMGQQHGEVPQHLKAVYDFVRKALKDQIATNWVLQAEAEVQSALKYKKIIMTVGKRVGEKVTLQSEGGKGLGTVVAESIREKIGMGLVGSIVQNMEPRVAVRLSPGHFSAITVDVVEVQDNQCFARMSGSWTHPLSGEVIPITGTVIVEMEHLTKRGNGQ